MRIGVFSVLFQDLPIEQALDKLVEAGARLSEGDWKNLHESLLEIPEHLRMEFIQETLPGAFRRGVIKEPGDWKKLATGSSN